MPAPYRPRAGEARQFWEQLRPPSGPPAPPAQPGRNPAISEAFDRWQKTFVKRASRRALAQDPSLGQSLIRRGTGNILAPAEERVARGIHQQAMRNWAASELRNAPKAIRHAARAGATEATPRSMPWTRATNMRRALGVATKQIERASASRMAAGTRRVLGIADRAAQKSTIATFLADVSAGAASHEAERQRQRRQRSMGMRPSSL